MKIAINKCFGGFGLSKEAYKELGIEWDGYGYAYGDDEKHTDPQLIAVIEKLGEKASGPHAAVEVVEIPDDVKWEMVDEYDGIEITVLGDNNVLYRILYAYPARKV